MLNLTRSKYLVNRRREVESSKLNTCAFFILPMVNINHKILPKKQFINCYVDKDYHIYLIFEVDKDFEQLTQGIFTYIKEDNEYLLETTMNNDEYIFKFRIPQECEKDFDMFMKGSYSNFSILHKNKLLLYFQDKPIKQGRLVNVANAIYPENFKRLQIAKELDVDVSLIHEVFDPPNLDKELYKTIDSYFHYMIFILSI